MPVSASGHGASGNSILKNTINPQGGTMASKASAVWTGSLKEGKGTISTTTGVLENAKYSFASRFEGADSGTTPEELIAAAHASCFSMALGAQLGGAGLTPDEDRNPSGRLAGQGWRRLRHHAHRADHHSQRSRRSPEVFDKAAAGCQDRLPDLEALRQQHRDHARRQAGLAHARRVVVTAIASSGLLDPMSMNSSGLFLRKRPPSRIFEWVY